jgi:hypothetical protein
MYLPALHSTLRKNPQHISIVREMNGLTPCKFLFCQEKQGKKINTNMGPIRTSYIRKDSTSIKLKRLVRHSGAHL